MSDEYHGLERRQGPDDRREAESWWESVPRSTKSILGCMLLISFGIGWGVWGSAMVGLPDIVAEHERRIGTLETGSRNTLLYTACRLDAMQDGRTGRDCETVLPMDVRQELWRLRREQ